MAKNQRRNEESQPKSGGKIKRSDVEFTPIPGTTQWKAKYGGKSATGGSQKSAFDRLRESS